MSKSRAMKNARRRQNRFSMIYGTGKVKLSMTLTKAQRKMINIWKRTTKFTQPKKDISAKAAALGAL